ncbi:methyl-accepting chemotaxis protein [Paraglaciecola sp.]|uniref:methyl-accepting chemotaxis protein n=1 Tax=Paraglaciecola sp. TaxID=1920173 RepID=UPI0030F470F3
MNIRTKMLISLCVTIAFILLAIMSEMVAVSKNEQQVEAGRIRYLSYNLADEFRHTSMDLTRLARTYVATTDKEYFDQYFAIVDWQGGKTPRPVTVNPKLYPGQKKSQTDIMVELQFSAKELDLMAQAAKNSKNLINTETQAMESVRQNKMVTGPFTPKQGETVNDFALRILFDDNYHNEVTEIMAPVNLFFQALDKRTGEQLEEARNAASFWLNAASILQIICGLIVLGLTWFMLQYLFSPLRKVVDTFIAVDMGNGDINLSLRLDEDGQPEMSALAKSFNLISSGLKNLLEKFSKSITELSASSTTLHSIAATTNASVDKQQESLDQIATAVHEMVATVQDVTRNAAEASTTASQSDQEVSMGLTIVAQAISSMEQLAREISSASGAIQHVEKDSNTISTILDVIKAIAEQTNLLALNAAIEAARAGEQGRGFAVVADEVRSLAKRTQDSTAQIQKMISSLQLNSKRAVEAMNSSSEQSVICVENTGKAGESLTTISSRIAAISDMNTQIATATEEQGVVVEEISRNIHIVLQEVQQSAAAAKETARNSDGIKRVAEELGHMAKKFKLS